MKTKKILMTTALTALFAACSNEEFLDSTRPIQSGDAARPLVENVSLQAVMGESAMTRLYFDGTNNVWQAGDTIGALLMDEIRQEYWESRPHDSKWEDLTWYEKYKLVDYINTDYPFVLKDGNWTCDAKMLEGNYFFTYPFASYGGKREAVHRIDNQVQKGVTAEALRKSYVDNQFYIGYARVHEGMGATETIDNRLTMTPVLGAVGIKIKNVGTGSFTVKKIVLTSEDFSTEIKVDPVNAEYLGERPLANANYNQEGYIGIYNNENELEGIQDYYLTNAFNYANYEEMVYDKASGTWGYPETFKEKYSTLFDGKLVNNTKKSDNYDRNNALRAVIKELKGDNQAQLFVEDAPALKSQESQNFIIMTNIYKYNETNAITAKVYTDKGLMNGVVISNVNGEVKDPSVKGVTVISDNPIVEINPSTQNLVTLELDDNSVQAPNQLDIYNESDLMQLIEWNATTSRNFTATLQNDVMLTKEMSDALLKATRANLIVEGCDHELLIDHKLLIDKDADSKILNKVLVKGTVEVHNNLVLDENSYVAGVYTKYAKTIDLGATNKLEVAEGASLTVSGKVADGLDVTNEGTFNINANVEKLTVENKGKMTVAAEVKVAGISSNGKDAVLTVTEAGTLRCGGNFTNMEGAVIYNSGKLFNLINGTENVDPEERAKVIAGENSVTNIDVEDDEFGVIDITEAGLEADLNEKAYSGTVAYTLSGEATMKAINDAKITSLTIDGGKITSSALPWTCAINENVEKIVVTEKGASIVGTSVTDDQFTKAEMEVNGKLTLKNVEVGGYVTIKSGTTTVEGTVETGVIELASYDEEQYKSYDATLYVTKNAKLTAENITYGGDANVEKPAVATIDNQGEIKTRKDYAGEGIVTSGNAIGKIESGDDTENIIELNVKITNKSGDFNDKVFNSLKALDGFMTNEEEWPEKTKYVIKDITIDIENENEEGALSGLTLTAANEEADYLDNDYHYLQKWAEGKEVKLACPLEGLTEDMNLKFDKLTATDFDAQVKGDEAQSNRTILTVNSLDYTMGQLFVYCGYIQIEGEARIGESSNAIKGDYNKLWVSENYRPNGGKVVTVNESENEDAGALIQWSPSQNKWIALD